MAHARALLVSGPEGTADLNPEPMMNAAKAYRDNGLSFVLRSKDGVQRFLTDNGFTPIEPGMVPVHRWRPDHRPWPLSTPPPARRGSLDDTDGLDALDALDALEKLRYQDINDVTDADVNVYGVLASKA